VAPLLGCSGPLRDLSKSVAQLDEIVPAAGDGESPHVLGSSVNCPDPRDLGMQPTRYDPGLQQERIKLSWNRTSLSMIVGGLAGPKLLPALMGAVGIALDVAAVAAGIGLGLASRRRAARHLRVFLTDQGVSPDARLLFGVAWSVSLLAALAAVTVVLLSKVRCGSWI
jgi:uncharacterized membrane protein YidH (DUF202 family)